MRALILAAGLGTRLLPYTLHTPKPLFPVSGRPLLDIHIRKLIEAGCEAVVVNTHHLHEQIRDFIAAQDYPLPVGIRHEPLILGTGGAIGNVRDFWGDMPFLVLNSDILSNTDLREVYDFHMRHDCPVTMVLHHQPEFNHVSVSEDGFVRGFHESGNTCLKKAFTGIQVLDPGVKDFFPSGEFSSSIDIYRQMLRAGIQIRAFDGERYSWQDMGTPRRYRDTVREIMTAEAFSLAWPGDSHGCFENIPLKGDGSDREWLRIRSRDKSLVMVDHGIRMQKTGTSESDSFADIGEHLFRGGVSVPRIYLHERFSGMVFMEDLGDTRLQTVLRSAPDIRKLYRTVIDKLVDLWLCGKENFNPDWCWQSPCYDRELILEKECRYFTEAFLRGYLGLESSYEDFQEEFEFLADRIGEYACIAFMHRDMQSRNIMVRNGEPVFIDFQAGRMGPVQYDLASLLIDPYARIPSEIQGELLEYAMGKLADRIPFDSEKFRAGYEYCALSRNLQILGAFGFLSKVKKKEWFEYYIPAAYDSLLQILSGRPDGEMQELQKTVLNHRLRIQNRGPSFR